MPLSSTHCDLHMGVWPALPDAAAGAAVDAGAGAVDDGHGDLGLKLVHPVQHGSGSPAKGVGHILKGCFPAGTVQEKKN